MSQVGEDIVPYRVDACPHCGGVHDYTIVIRPAPLLFGGTGADADLTHIAVRCPQRDLPVAIEVPIPDGMEFAGVRQPDDTPEAFTPQARADDPEYVEWRTQSRAIGLDYGKTMLPTSSGAIAVYYSVLTYLGSSHHDQLPAGVTVVPAALFLLAGAAFTISLLPRLMRVSPDRFQRFRDDRLRWINTLLLTGVSLFFAGLAAALAIFSATIA